jgi:GNAT superfamily N-acetyltransferase
VTYRIESLASGHRREAFSCGIEELDRYLMTQASQDVRRNVANCFVAIATDTGAIAGFYTLAAASIPLAELPAEQARRLPRYPVLPAALIGRLAIDRGHAGKSLGSALLFDAIERAAAAAPAIFALIVDAKSDNAGRFYTHFGFQPFTSRPLSFFLPMATARKLL